MLQRKITIREIAEAAGVSTSAVSYVLNNRQGVSEATRKRIQRVIDDHRYEPNINSVRLVSQKSFNIRIAIRDQSSPFQDFFYFEIAQGVLERSGAAGYNLVFSNLSLGVKSEAFLRSVDRGDTDGIIFFQDVDQTLLARLREADVPAVVIDAHQSDDSIVQVNADYRVATETATGFLISQGHTRVALIGSNLVSGYFTQVFAGFRSAVENAGLSVPVSWVMSENLNDHDAEKSMKLLLSHSPRPTGIVCASDLLAVGAMHAIQSAGLHVPDDVSVTGIDDIVLARFIQPNLTTIRIDKKEMGRVAVELLLQIIAGESPSTVTVVSNDLVIRDSAGAAAST